MPFKILKVTIEEVTVDELPEGTIWQEGETIAITNENVIYYMNNSPAPEEIEKSGRAINNAGSIYWPEIAP